MPSIFKIRATRGTNELERRTTSLNDKQMNDISQLIRLKERELHEIHDIRCSQMERIITERDSLLVEHTKKYEQLKEDFTYNLQLLEARDEEINRLDKELDQINKNLREKESELQSLRIRLEQSSQREQEKSRKFEEEKAASKKKLMDLKEQIEYLGWATAEEMKSKSRDVEMLRDELQRATISREESLESQRRDLTTTFEGTPKVQRYVSFPHALLSSLCGVVGLGVQQHCYSSERSPSRTGRRRLANRYLCSTADLNSSGPTTVD